LPTLAARHLDLLKRQAVLKPWADIHSYSADFLRVRGWHPPCFDKAFSMVRSGNAALEVNRGPLLYTWVAKPACSCHPDAVSRQPRTG
jgi:hypothetical protein